MNFKYFFNKICFISLLFLPFLVCSCEESYNETNYMKGYHCAIEGKAPGIFDRVDESFLSGYADEIIEECENEKGDE